MPYFSAVGLYQYLFPILFIWGVVVVVVVVVVFVVVVVVVVFCSCFQQNGLSCRLSFAVHLIKKIIDNPHVLLTQGRRIKTEEN